jgi:hypothetical protein
MPAADHRLRAARLLSLAVLCALALTAVLGPGTAAAEEPPPCIEAGFPALGVHILRVEVKAPQGEWTDQVDPENEPGGVCAGAGYEAPNEVAVRALAFSPLVAGDKIRVTVESDLYTPLYLVGLFSPGPTIYEGNRVIVTGTVNEIRLPQEAGEDCVIDEEEPQPQWLLFLQLDRGDPAEEAYAGSYFATNSYPAVPKVLEGGKAFGLELSGCGDGDPNTADGFFDGFIPDAAAAKLGISPELIASLTAPVAGQLVQVTNNGQPTNAGLTLEKVEGGIKFGYSLSYSSHHILIRANHKAIALTRRCQRTHGKLRVERVRHKTRRTQLACR